MKENQHHLNSFLTKNLQNLAKTNEMCPKILRKSTKHFKNFIKGSILLSIMCHAPMGRFQFESKIGITFIFMFHRRPIQIDVVVPVALSTFLWKAYRNEHNYLNGTTVKSENKSNSIFLFKDVHQKRFRLLRRRGRNILLLYSLEKCLKTV